MSRTILSRIVAVIGALTVLPGCGGSVPDPAPLRDQLASANAVRFRCELDGVPADWTVSDPAVLADLSRKLEFRGKPLRVRDRLSTTDVILVSIVRDGLEEPLFSLVAGDRILYGPSKEYYVKLAKRDLHETLISQARQAGRLRDDGR